MEDVAKYSSPMEHIWLWRSKVQAFRNKACVFCVLAPSQDLESQVYGLLEAQGSSKSSESSDHDLTTRETQNHLLVEVCSIPTSVWIW